LPLYVLVPAFYARELAIPIALVGQALLAVRIVDALSDPLVGIFADPTVVADRRFRLEENGISSLSVQSDEDVIELYVPAEEKDEGFAVLQGSAEEGGLCHECRIQYPADHEVCPLCGGKHTEPEGRSERDE